MSMHYKATTETILFFLLFSDSFHKIGIIAWKNLPLKPFEPGAFFVTKGFKLWIQFI